VIGVIDISFSYSRSRSGLPDSKKGEGIKKNWPELVLTLMSMTVWSQLNTYRQSNSTLQRKDLIR